MDKQSPRNQAHAAMKFIFLLALAGLSGAGFAQEATRATAPFCTDTAAHMGRMTVEAYQHLPGVFVLRNGDTLAGCMYLSRSHCIFPKENNRVRFIRARQVKKIELQLYSLHRRPTEIYTMDL